METRKSLDVKVRQGWEFVAAVVLPVLAVACVAVPILLSNGSLTVVKVLPVAITFHVLTFIVVLLSVVLVSDSRHRYLANYIDQAWKVLQAEWEKHLGGIAVCKEDWSEDLDARKREITLYHDPCNGQLYARGMFVSSSGIERAVMFPLACGNQLNVTNVSDLDIPRLSIEHKLITEAGGIPPSLLCYADEFFQITQAEAVGLRRLVSSDFLEESCVDNVFTHLRVHLHLPQGIVWHFHYKPLPEERLMTPIPPTGSSPDEEVSSETSDLTAPNGPPTVDPEDAPSPEKGQGALDFPSGTPLKEDSEQKAQVA
ncbi:hypothetical protein ACFL1U_02260 [Patescibacteria group bacterium]